MPKLAVLIDAENISHTLWPKITDIANRLGKPVIVRAYTCHPNGWASEPDVEIIDGAPTGGRNAADFILAMDAARLVDRRKVRHFLLVSGDDGFSAIAAELRRSGARSVHAAITPALAGGKSRLAAAADLAILLPAEPDPATNAQPTPKPAATKKAPIGWSADNIEIAMLRCPRDDEGWTTMSRLGSAFAVMGIIPPKKGSLAARVRRQGRFEISPDGNRVRLMTRE